MKFEIGEIIMVKNQYSEYKNLIGQVESIYDKEKKIYRCAMAVNGTSNNRKLIMFRTFEERELNIVNYQPILDQLRDIRRSLKCLNIDKVPDTEDVAFLEEFDKSINHLVTRVKKYKQKHIDLLEKN